MRKTIRMETKVFIYYRRNGSQPIGTLHPITLPRVDIPKAKKGWLPHGWLCIDDYDETKHLELANFLHENLSDQQYKNFISYLKQGAPCKK